MSATMVAAIPLALLGVVALLGFAGCILPAYLPAGEGSYDDLVKSEGSLVAFWTLTEARGMTAVDETSNHFDGTYMTGLGPSAYDPNALSAKASGDVTLNQPGIIPGDAVQGQPADPCPAFDGGIVSVKWQQAINMDPPFTLEAWVLPGWTADDVTNQPALRGVVVSNSKVLSTGFGLFASSDNVWLLSLGMGSTSIEVKPAAGGTPIDLSKPTHLVVTYDGAMCNIFANAALVAQFDTSTTGMKYLPVKDTALFIGAGNPEQGTSQPPLFPFNGRIQCVALYSTVLPMPSIVQHFAAGQGGG